LVENRTQKVFWVMKTRSAAIIFSRSFFVHLLALVLKLVPASELSGRSDGFEIRVLNLKQRQYMVESGL